MRVWLKDLRNTKGWTQEIVANKLGVSRQAYAQIEAGERQADLNLSTASKLADIFKISLSKIRNYEEALSNNAR